MNILKRAKEKREEPKGSKERSPENENDRSPQEDEQPKDEKENGNGKPSVTDKVTGFM